MIPDPELPATFRWCERGIFIVVREEHCSRIHVMRAHGSQGYKFFGLHHLLRPDPLFRPGMVDVEHHFGCLPSLSLIRVLKCSGGHERPRAPFLCESCLGGERDVRVERQYPFRSSTVGS